MERADQFPTEADRSALVHENVHLSAVNLRLTEENERLKRDNEFLEKMVKIQTEALALLNEGAQKLVSTLKPGDAATCENTCASDGLAKANGRIDA